jgi:NhaP-type Na+/H+ or K+/H+ antiporter
MALSLPAGPGRDLLVAVTYGVVVFGFLVQGTTLSRLIGRHSKPNHDSRTRREFRTEK